MSRITKIGIPSGGTTSQVLVKNSNSDYDVTWGAGGGGGITGSGTSGYVTYWTGSSAVSGESNLFWDASTDRLGIKTNTPAYNLDVNGTARIQDDLTISEAKNIILGTTTGTKIGTATTQKIGFFNATPIIRPSAYTQTYSTATKTHSNLTSSDLTGITSSSTGSALSEPSATYQQTEMRTNFRRLQDQFNNLKADLTNLKQVVNQIIDDNQSLGLFG